MSTVASRIIHLRDVVLGMTQTQFAKLLRGGHEFGTPTRGAVGNWERGMGIKTENLLLISERTGAPLDWLAKGVGPAPSSAEELHEQWVTDRIDDAENVEFAPPGPAQVPLVGYVGASSEAHFYAVAQENLDWIKSPEGATKFTVAVEIRGDSLGLMFDRWIVFYDDVRSPITPDLLGRLCVVGLPDERVLIKKVRRSHDRIEDRYDLISEREEPIKNVAIAWAARERRKCSLSARIQFSHGHLAYPSILFDPEEGASLAKTPLPLGQMALRLESRRR